MSYENELYHYGVLGMKWGVHRAKVNTKRADKHARIAKKLTDDPNFSDAAGRKATKHFFKAARADAKSEYSYKSWGTKHNEKKSAKVSEKLKNKELTDKQRSKLETKKMKFDRRAERSATLDKREQEYATRVKAGGNIAVRMLTGGAVGSKPYQQYAAMMGAQGKGHKAMKLGAAIATSTLGGRLGSTAVKAIYLRAGESDYIKEKKK